MTEITRQNLEDAALAIGGTLSPGNEKVRVGETWDNWEWRGPLGIEVAGTIMHPHSDDGDAFKLMIRMQMRVEILPCWATAVIDGEEENGVRYDAPEELPRAARTVIVLCAAAVGERMREGGL